MKEGGRVYFHLCRDRVSSPAPTSPPGLLFTRPLFIHRIKETICLINARVFNLPALLLLQSMHKCPHHYNGDIDLLLLPRVRLECEIHRDDY